VLSVWHPQISICVLRGSQKNIPMSKELYSKNLGLALLNNLQTRDSVTFEHSKQVVVHVDGVR
jgi:hypothetical protein